MNISVIVPVYNSSELLDDCIKSILNQSFQDFELLLIDDGSTDHSLELCENWSKKDSRIITFRQNNLGASVARNTGIKLAKGTWIVFVDSDDTVMPTYLEDLLRMVNNGHDIDLCISGLKVIRNGEVTEKKSFIDTTCLMSDYKTLFEQISIQNYGFSVGKIYRKSIIDDNNIQFNNNVCIAEDCIFMLNYIMACSINKKSEIAFISQCNYNYVIRNGSLSTSVSSYEHELYNYQEYKKAINNLKSTFNINSIVYNKLCSSLPFYIDRIINAIYKENSKDKRITNLKSLNLNDYRKFKKCKTSFEYILFYLLTHRHWRVYDLIRNNMK